VFSNVLILKNDYEMAIYCTDIFLFLTNILILFKKKLKVANFSLAFYRAQILIRQTQGLTRGSPPFYISNAVGEPRVKPGVRRPEMWAQFLEHA
jgi:hypothetical protein